MTPVLSMFTVSAELVTGNLSSSCMFPGGAGTQDSQLITSLAPQALHCLNQMLPHHTRNFRGLRMGPAQSTALKNSLGRFQAENHHTLVALSLILKQEVFTVRNRQLSSRKKRRVKSLVLVLLKHLVPNAADQRCSCMFQEEGGNAIRNLKKTRPQKAGGVAILPILTVKQV